MGNLGEQEEQMRAFGIIMIVCGVVIIVTTIWELATGSLTNPTLLFVGPLFLLGGIIRLATQKNRPMEEDKSNKG